MKKSINLNSQEWCNIIFENKNHAYGAYAMRQSSNKRHLFAFCTVLLLVALVSILPKLIESVKAATGNRSNNITDVYNTSTIEVENTKPEEVLEPKIPEPPKYVESIKFVPPVIGNDEKVNDENLLHTVDEVNKSDAVIGKFDVAVGSKDKDAVIKIQQITSEKDATETKTKPVNIAEVMPQFPGGVDEMQRYIAENLKYPVAAQEAGIQGRVTIRFVVAKTGAIENVEVLRGIDPSCDKEALRVVKSMPRWIPGKQNGTPVAVYFTIPIVFRLKN